jgi:hypothetical protein
MSARIRVETRAQNQSRATSNSSTSIVSRVRSTATRDQNLPYESFIRRTSDSGNNSPSTALKRLSKSKKFTNNGGNEAAGSKSFDNKQRQRQRPPQQQQQQNVTTDEDADLIDDEEDDSPINISRTTTQSINNQSSIANTTSTTDIVQNLSLNDNSSVIPKVVHGSGVINNQALPMNNAQVYQLFDKMSNDLFRCKLCQKVRRCFLFSNKHFDR